MLIPLPSESDSRIQVFSTLPLPEFLQETPDLIHIDIARLLDIIALEDALDDPTQIRQLIQVRAGDSSLFFICSVAPLHCEETRPLSCFPLLMIALQQCESEVSAAQRRSWDSVVSWLGIQPLRFPPRIMLTPFLRGTRN